jgi:4-hydroxy-tetrahydrodipicolinate reductase
MRWVLGFQVNDCSGKMGGAVAEAAVGAGLKLVPVCLTGPGLGRSFTIQGISVEAVDSKDREGVLDRVVQEYPNVIVVDYTLPAAVNGERSAFALDCELEIWFSDR